tara:strand:+ start:690 stop:1877 length:1188 start_codon:yes stop_codon:yes gene_type:complete
MAKIKKRMPWFSGQGLWKETPAEDWGSWSWQLRNRITNISQLESLMTLTEAEKAGCEFANEKLALAITPYFFNLIDREDKDCPIRKQLIPRDNEMTVAPWETLDPLAEDSHLVVPGLVHRYPDRALFLVTNHCAAYCRYCTRSRLVSNSQGYDFHPQIEQAFEYLEKTPHIRDVLISGGDPLLLSDKKLDYLLGRLHAIEHIEFVRIGSRIPVFLPQRITSELCDIFLKHEPLWMSIHVNHPAECSEELREATGRLSRAGIPLGNQSVLLRGVNDDVETMKELVHRLLQMRVRPYYLYQLDAITGSSHFKVDLKKGIEIIQGLRGHTTGYAIPQYVIDAPQGGGKIPVNPDYVEGINEGEIVLRNFEGKIFRYATGTLETEKSAEKPGFPAELYA